MAAWVKMVSTACRNMFLLLILLAALTCFTPCSFAGAINEEIDDLIQDEQESKDLLKKEVRFVPVPIIISNPTLGTGLAVAGIYLHPHKNNSTAGRSTISGVAGLHTNNGSWLGAVFHDGAYARDKYRVSGTLAYGEFKLKFYGIGNNSPIRDHPVDYAAETTAFTPRVLFRLPFKGWFMGPSYTFLRLDNTFDLSSQLPGLPEISIPTQTAGVGVVTAYDSRDFNLWPSDGSFFELTASDYGEYLGGDFSYQKLIAKFIQYHPVTPRITLAYRLDGAFIGGQPPFYDLASLSLRGFPRGFYADKSALAAQVQTNWLFHKRWTAIIFGGGGRVADEVGHLGQQPTRWAGGTGIRYVVNQKQKLSLGIDLTFGEGEAGLYVQVGDGLSR